MKVKMKNLCDKIILLSIFAFIAPFGNAITFNRTTTGVEFSAYVKKSGENAGWMSYSIEDMKTMLQVILGKFSKVNTYGSGADNVPYVENQTYYKSNAQARTAEAAALINRENNNLSLTILAGIWLADIDQHMETEIKVALESVQIAHEIYPETVTGFVISHPEIGKSIGKAKQTLELLKSLRNTTLNLRLKIGSRQICYNLTSKAPYDPTTDAGKLLITRQLIVVASDFIICEAEPAQHNIRSGAKGSFTTVGNDLLGFRHDFKKLNPQIEVMGQTKWPSKGDKPWENIENLRDFWIEADNWASENEFSMWLLEAFDNPWKDWNSRDAYYGWWKLRSNDLTDKIEGYAEKIYEPPEEEPAPPGLNPWIYVGIGIGVVAFLSVVILITMLFMRINRIQEALTTDDVRDFMYGISDEAAAQGGQGAIESALKFPYDKSYEIAKEKLKIRREHLLGAGEFGCVYRALIEDEENTEVALKMAKHDCPKSALKGILSEIKILTYLGKHPNIVSIYGAYTAELVKGVVYVATELCTLGSLENYLRNAQTGVSQNRYANSPTLSADIYENAQPEIITFKEMIRISHEIACGMEYLGTKHVVHADLATRNVLLSYDKTAKITDFGLSRRLYDYTNYVKKQQEPLPWRWMAIESLKRLEFSAKSDVWSYGVTLWEIYALGDLPYPGLSWNLDFVDSLVNGLRMKSPPHATSEVYQIMLDCWHLDPKERPTFTDLKLSTAEIFDKAIDSK